MNFEVENQQKLLSTLKHTIYLRPSLYKERNTEESEVFGIGRLLAFLSDLKFLSYPLSLKHLDRPDFILSMEDKTIGIEITELLINDIERASKYWRECKDYEPLDLSIGTYGAPLLAKEVFNYRNSAGKWEVWGKPLLGSNDNQELLRALSQQVLKKRDKLRHYKSCSEYWLYIYECFRGRRFNIDELKKNIIELSGSFFPETCFQKIFLDIHGRPEERFMLSISKNKLSTRDFTNHWINLYTK